MEYYMVEGGVKIAVQDINPGGGQTVFMIHGWPLAHSMFEYQLNVLPYEGYRCIAVDLRGFGKSDMPFDGYSYDAMAQDIARIIEAMRLTDIVLAGFSMGGALAIRYISRYGESRIRRLALIGAAAPCFTQRPGFPYGMTKEQADATIASIRKDRPKAVDDFGKMLFASDPSQELKDWFRDMGWRAGGISSIETFKSLRDEDLRPDLPHISVPTGIFHGRLDKVCPYELALEMQKGIRNAQLYTFEKSGHALFYDEMEKFNDIFLKFLKN